MTVISRLIGAVLIVLVLATSGTQLIPKHTVRLTPKITNTHQVPEVLVARLTPEGQPYRILFSNLRISVYNAESESNNREIIWDDNARESSSAAQCTTWTSGSGIAQNGLVFRVSRQSGGYNAIVFARNIFQYWFWRFAPKMFHTGSDYQNDWSDVSGIDLDAYIGHVSADIWPLRVCASLDSSNVLRFAVAKGSDSMPPLSNPGVQGGSWNLDIPQYYHPGEGLVGKNGGTFVGHVPIGTSIIVGDNRTITLDSGYH